jgi:hypothetical protein
MCPMLIKTSLQVLTLQCETDKVCTSLHELIPQTFFILVISYDLLLKKMFGVASCIIVLERLNLHFPYILVI